MAIKIHVQHIWPAPENDTMIGPTMGIVYDGQMKLMQSILGPDAVIRNCFNNNSSYFTRSINEF